MFVGRLSPSVICPEHVTALLSLAKQVEILAVGRGNDIDQTLLCACFRSLCTSVGRWHVRSLQLMTRTARSCKQFWICWWT